MGKKTKSTSSVAAPTVPAPTASTKKSKKEKESAPGNVRHRHQRRKGKKMYTVSVGQAKRLALRAGETSISIQRGVPQFLTMQVHHLAQTLGPAARAIADTRKRNSTIRASDLQEAIRTQYHFRVYNTSSMLSDEKHARHTRTKRLAREREQAEKKRADAAVDAATSDAAGA